jgi:hypothetical protein
MARNLPLGIQVSGYPTAAPCLSVSGVTVVTHVGTAHSRRGDG